ncbi:penicillin-binding transpeptidase domain-containing protein [Nonomuraea ceibae]|uniref:penicillin-binding transpeptidase domain-containing protein n=1 Tax=Nonomuraea ceibae TaxID=1935170 RepID=UPI001C5EF953|nr:penicillin-binding transpeptidase domain-containing protein [Nonomuraea ceibae]
MRRRRLIVLLGAVLAVMAAVAFAVAAAGGVRGSAAATAKAYFDAWRAGDVGTMSRLVDRPPGDFRERHRAMDAELGVTGLELRPAPVKSTGEESAEAPFSGVRTLDELGEWPFDGVLRLAVRDGEWKVLWAPETLHPVLKGGATVELTDFEGPAVELVTREGDPIPRDSHVESYLARLRPEFGDVNLGLALVAKEPGGAERRLLTAEPKPNVVRLTLSRPVQAAAARALDGVENSSIVVLRPGTGEVLAVADRLKDNYSAFHDMFPPGSTFKTIVAAALLKSGLQPGSPVPCPARYAIPGHRGFDNDGERDRGVVSFADALAYSCNTTFVQQGTTRLDAEELRETALEWGFGRSMPTGAQGACGSIEDPQTPDDAGANIIGQGKVLATPLCMAAIAAAVQDGTLRSPRLLAEKEVRRIDGPPHPPAPMDSTVVAGLRQMMRAVVDHGTASGAGLPPGVAGKTGTAEVQGQRPHAWFMGFTDDLAFCVFVRHGGSGGSAAVPIAVRFLNGL